MLFLTANFVFLLTAKYKLSSIESKDSLLSLYSFMTENSFSLLLLPERSLSELIIRSRSFSSKIILLYILSYLGLLNENNLGCRKLLRFDVGKIKGKGERLISGLLNSGSSTLMQACEGNICDSNLVLYLINNFVRKK